MLTWLENEVLPDTFKDAKSPSIVITNTGAMRFDIFKGPFTIDTTFLVSPFTSSFRKLKDVPYKVASQVLRLLNNGSPIALNDLVALSVDDDAFGEHRLHDLLAPLPPYLDFVRYCFTQTNIQLYFSQSPVPSDVGFLQTTALKNRLIKRQKPLCGHHDV